MEVNRKNLDNWALSIEAFQWIRNHIPDGAPIVELGSGTGTIELSKFYDVTTVENDIKFVGQAPDATYIHAPLNDGWYNEAAVFNNLPKEYSLLIIDGPTVYRRNIIKYLDRFRHDVPILYDDTHRVENYDCAMLIAKKLKKSFANIVGWQKSFAVLTDGPID